MTPMEEAKALLARKDKLEAEMAAAREELAQLGVAMEESLIDEQDFPRSDVDVHGARHLRHTIRCLETDLKTVMGDIERAIAAVHAAARDTKDTVAASDDEAAAATTAALPDSAEPELEAFAFVERVDSDSPAAQARNDCLPSRLLDPACVCVCVCVCGGNTTRACYQGTRLFDSGA
ncbi:uncharacterized protein MONBRDRAFT_27868 [Monosiga brevicollis MX1]|uniref:Nas2 N-terminal domain-containing protein n=1 Tax=Monosiga brevicollis TaxID=81824 RepID=A9V6Q1_MONBE|nr:uncharacterized protein MONBRDRAFT_27868 [Monosiga brevicollis MX1]EDQ86844.1 predicted protein [Monosiga brevicollis MX1]|eukprot:XP_001748389.1 hypothetical protein [Monosiga brevicollis MX1]